MRDRLSLFLAFGLGSVCALSSTSTWAASAYFAESFDSGESSDLEGYSAYTLEGGVVHLKSGATDSLDRHYLRTVVANYNLRDFTFDLTFTSSPDTITFVGIGRGEQDISNFNEPLGSVNLRIHPPDVAGGRVDLRTAQGSEAIGTIATQGPLRVRISKTGPAITFAVDVDSSGPFDPEIEKTLPDLAAAGDFLSNTSSHLFFGTGSMTTTFNELLIEGEEIIEPATLEARQVGPRCVSIVVRNDAPIKGGELGLAYDPTRVAVLLVMKGPDFPADGQLQIQLSAPIHCSAEDSVSAGLIVGWINPTSPQVLTPPGEQDLIRICFGPVGDEEPEPGTCSALRFVNCLGPVEAPIRAIVTTQSGASSPLRPAEGTVCLLDEIPFRRGDVNGDGNYDISDAISILGCLFLGTDCSACPDSSDANDDGLGNIADPVYLLNWRFLGGQAPAAPFPECGRDATPDELYECEDTPSCQ